MNISKADSRKQGKSRVVKADYLSILNVAQFVQAGANAQYKFAETCSSSDTTTPLLPLPPVTIPTSNNDPTTADQIDNKLLVELLALTLSSRVHISFPLQLRISIR